MVLDASLQPEENSGAANEPVQEAAVPVEAAVVPVASPAPDEVLPNDSQLGGAAATAPAQDQTGAPGASDSEPLPNAAAPTSYVIQPGDSLESIAESQLGDPGRAAELLALNSNVLGSDPGTVRVGVTIELPNTPE